MGKNDNKLLNILKFERSILSDFKNLIENMLEAEKSYKLTPSDMGKFDFSNKEIVDTLTKQFSSSELGLLIVISNELGNIQQDLLNFAKYDSTKKQKLVNDLVEVINNLNQILGDKKKLGTSTTRRSKRK